MISSNFIKSDDEMVIEIRKFVFLEIGVKDKTAESKITRFGSDFAEKSSNEQERNFWKIKTQKTEIKNEIDSKYDSKMKSKAIQRYIRMKHDP